MLYISRLVPYKLARAVRAPQINRTLSSIAKADHDKLTPTEDISPLITTPPSINVDDLFTVEDLFNARCHFGHKQGLYNPHMRPFIFGKRLDVLILDLDETARLLRLALQVTAQIAYRHGIILFVHRNKQTTHLIEDIAKECGEYAHCREWRNEVFSDSTNVFGAITRLPDLCIFLSTFSGFRPHRAIKMSAKLLIPTIGICDTNSDPTLITYPVPGNDDTIESIMLFSQLFKAAIMRGKEKRKEIIEKYGEDLYYKTIQ